MGPYSLVWALIGAFGLLKASAEQAGRNRKVDEANKRWREEQAIKKMYPKPNRDPKSGKIIIQNSILYYKDIREYGAYQAHQWIEQGKYNLNDDEMKIENFRLKKKYPNVSTLERESEELERKLEEMDWENTEAVHMWRKVCAMEHKC